MIGPSIQFDLDPKCKTRQKVWPSLRSKSPGWFVQDVV